MGLGISTLTREVSMNLSWRSEDFVLVPAHRTKTPQFPKKDEGEVPDGRKPSPRFSLPFTLKGRRLLLRKEKNGVLFFGEKNKKGFRRLQLVADCCCPLHFSPRPHANHRVGQTHQQFLSRVALP